MSGMRFHVLVTGDKLIPAAVQLLQTLGATLTMMGGKIDEQRLLDALAQQPADAVLMRGNPPFSRAVLDRAPGLRVIAKHGVGVDSVDLSAATDRGIAVTVAGDANAPAVAEHTVALMLALARDLVPLDRGVRGGVWARGGYLGRELRGRTLGLVGFGRIGRRVAGLACCLGVTVAALPNRRGTVNPALAQEETSLEALLARSDILSLHVPLTEATRGMIDARALGQLPSGAILINTSRGALVDEAALAEALSVGRLAGAALDTLEEEPPPPGAPLLQAPNLLVTPHIAAMTGAAIARMGVTAAQNIVDVLTGKGPNPDNLANPAVLGRAG